MIRAYFWHGTTLLDRDSGVKKINKSLATAAREMASVALIYNRSVVCRRANFEPIFIRSSSLCCVARQKCSIIGNENNNNTIF